MFIVYMFIVYMFIVYMCIVYMFIDVYCLQDEELLFMSRGYRGPRRVEESDALAGEFKLAKDKQTYDKQSVHK